jgi:flagellar biosynthesis protein FlhG
MPAELKEARRFAIISGKGGVGKTVITANVAAALAATGQRTLVIDADLGLANLDVILGIYAPHSLHDIFRGSHGIDDVIIPTPGGFDLLPASSGLPEGTALTPTMAQNLENLVNKLDLRYDKILFDAGAGIGDAVLFFARLADCVLLVVTPEPTSMADAYATIKVLANIYGRKDFFIIVNQANALHPENMGTTVANHLQNVASRFIKTEDHTPIRIQLIGSIPTDPAVIWAINHQQLLKDINPQAPSMCFINKLADSMLARISYSPTSIM